MKIEKRIKAALLFFGPGICYVLLALLLAAVPAFAFGKGLDTSLVLIGLIILVLGGATILVSALRGIKNYTVIRVILGLASILVAFHFISFAFPADVFRAETLLYSVLVLLCSAVVFTLARVKEKKISLWLDIQEIILALMVLACATAGLANVLNPVFENLLLAAFSLACAHLLFIDTLEVKYFLRDRRSLLEGPARS